MTIGYLRALLSVNPRGFTAGLGRARAGVASFVGGLKSAFSLGNVIIGGGAAYLGKQFFDAGFAALENKEFINAAFGDMARKATAWSADIQKATGAYRIGLERDAAETFIMARAMGATKDEAFEVATAITMLAHDMASLWEMDPKDVLKSLKGGLSGSMKVMKELVKLGINLEEGTGMHGAGKAMTQHEGLLHRFGMTMRATAMAQGAMARAFDENEGKLLKFNTTLKEIKTGIGAGLIPVVVGAIGAIQGVGEQADKTNSTMIKAMKTTGEVVSIVADAAWMLRFAWTTAAMAIGVAGQFVTGILGFVAGQIGVFLGWVSKIPILGFIWKTVANTVLLGAQFIVSSITVVLKAFSWLMKQASKIPGLGWAKDWAAGVDSAAGSMANLSTEMNKALVESVATTGFFDTWDMPGQLGEQLEKGGSMLKDFAADTNTSLARDAASLSKSWEAGAPSGRIKAEIEKQTAILSGTDTGAKLPEVAPGMHTEDMLMGKPKKFGRNVRGGFLAQIVPTPAAAPVIVTTNDNKHLMQQQLATQQEMLSAIKLGGRLL